MLQSPIVPCLYLSLACRADSLLLWLQWIDTEEVFVIKVARKVPYAVCCIIKFFGSHGDRLKLDGKREGKSSLTWLSYMTLDSCQTSSSCGEASCKSMHSSHACEGHCYFWKYFQNWRGHTGWAMGNNAISSRKGYNSSNTFHCMIFSAVRMKYILRAITLCSRWSGIHLYISIS